MADIYRPLFDGLKETAAALTQAGEASQQALEAGQLAIAASQRSLLALKRAGATIAQIADTAMEVREEHEDLRVTVARLETLVIAQGQDLKAMRDRLDNPKGDTN